MKTDNEKYNEQVKPNTAFLNDLKSKLPEFFTKDGSFDIDKFRGQLKEKNVNELSEGYQLNFIGKDYARHQAGEMPSTVIVPDEEQNNGEGKDSKNLFFTGDNLEVLRHLQNSYANKIDVIYIDPPYNTGNEDFVYPDSFEYSDDKLKEMFGLDDDKVERLKSIQGKSSHSAWLTFMYPRLQLAKRLLSNTGVVFISIDDNEEDNLSLLLNEIFGDSNRIALFPWRKRTAKSDVPFGVSQDYEYILAYAKSGKFLASIKGKERRYYETEDYPGRPWRIHEMTQQKSATERPNSYFTIVDPKTDKKFPANPNKTWRVTKETFPDYYNRGEIVFPDDYDFLKIKQPVMRYFKDNDMKKMGDLFGRTAVSTNLPSNVGMSKDGSADINLLFKSKVFNYPKPTALVRFFLDIINNKNAVVLDFFAGSGTTGEAVLQMNANDGGNRRFILAQLEEPTFYKKKGKMFFSDAYNSGFHSIDEISRERIRRAANKIKEDNGLTLPEDFDGSFKHYRVVKPTKQTLDEIEDFNPDETALFTNMVDGFSSQSLEVAGNASGEATIMTTWFAKDGYSFDVDVKQVDFAGYQGTVVDNNQLYLIKEGWGTKNTQELLNQLGTHKLDVQAVVIFGYSFNIAELRELENGLKQLENKVELQKRY